MKNKKAEMTTKQIVILIVLITSFAIILFFLFRLNLGDESDKQLCYNSVMNRANKMLPTEAVPLNCKRSYVCITKKDDCGMLDPIIEKVETKEDVYEALANELSDCWWMFGEGKLEYLEKDALPGLYCSICSQIKFDQSVKEIFDGKSDFNEREFYDFMCKNKLDSQSGPTYCEYMYNTNDLGEINQAQFDQIYLDDEYFALMGMSSDVSKLEWGLIGAGAVAAGVVITALTGGIAAYGIVTIVASGAIGTGVGGAAGSFILAPIKSFGLDQMIVLPTLIDVDKDEFKDLGCKDITTFS